MTEIRRWPEWVYGSGSEPDVRFSFANERTFLAWIRTALALLAAGVALDVVDLSLPAAAQRALAVLLVGVGVVTAAASWLRWARAERAMRRGEPLPASGSSAFLAVVVLLAGAVLIATVV
jgi:putative membrane protein